MKLVTVPEMREIEIEADATGLSYDDMMENAGKGIAEEVLTSYSHVSNKTILALVGSGNNGGDALVALSYLLQAGWKATAYVVKDRQPDDPLIMRVEDNGGILVNIQADQKLEQFETLVSKSSIILDGILGTGIHLPLKPDLASKLAAIKHILNKLDNPPIIIAVDCPSGIDCDSGETAPECIPADLTITMAAVKAGLFANPAAEYVGELRVVSIGNLDELKSWRSIKRYVATKQHVRDVLPSRSKFSHKGTFGIALIVGGSVNYTGAVLLAGEAAYRIGAGLVTIALPSSIHLAVAGQLPEATWILLPEEMGVIAESGSKILLQNLERIDALLFGPGFGLEDTSRNFIASLIGINQEEAKREIGFVRQSKILEKPELKLPPMVIDADGLKLLSKIDAWFQHLPLGSILTPHPGEMSIMTGLNVEEIQRDRFNVTRKYAKKWGHVVILKGAYTVIAAPDEQSTVIPVATPALARAGTGDVLAGIIVGLIAQGLPPYEAAVAGAWIHARSGVIAAEKLGTTASVVAGDVLHSINEVYKELNLQ